MLTPNISAASVDITPVENMIVGPLPLELFVLESRRERWRIEVREFRLHGMSALALVGRKKVMTTYVARREFE